MKKRFLAMMIVVTLLFGLVGVGTAAWFTSQATSTVEFQTGTLEIVAGDGEGVIANFEIKNLQPSFNYPNENPDEEPTNPPHFAYDPEVGFFKLTNIGSLPSKVYRMTVENIRKNNEDMDPVVNEELYMNFLKKLYVVVTAKEGAGLPDDLLYVGSMYNMAYDNGGYFDPFIFMEQGDNREVEFAVALHKNAGNEYQELGLMADFIIHAMQVEEPLPGEGADIGEEIKLGSGDGFDLYAKEVANHKKVGHLLDGQVGFSGSAYEFIFADKRPLKTFQYMEIELQHESDLTHDTKVTRVGILRDKAEVENIEKNQIDYKEITGASYKYIWISDNFLPEEWRLVQVRATYKWSDRTSKTEWLPYMINQ